MLDGILTTALQIIVILDICGAVLYLLMSGASKGKEAKTSESSPTPQFVFSSQLQPAMAGAGNVEPPPLPDWVSQGDRNATQIYGLEGTPDVTPEPLGLPARVGGIFSTLKSKFSRQNTHEISKSADLNSDRVWLNKVLESFREEM